VYRPCPELTENKEVAARERHLCGTVPAIVDGRYRHFGTIVSSPVVATSGAKRLPYGDRIEFGANQTCALVVAEVMSSLMPLRDDGCGELLSACRLRGERIWRIDRTLIGPTSRLTGRFGYDGAGDRGDPAGRSDWTWHRRADRIRSQYRAVVGDYETQTRELANDCSGAASGVVVRRRVSADRSLATD
jgi:hypothetical protein